VKSANDPSGTNEVKSDSLTALHEAAPITTYTAGPTNGFGMVVSDRLHAWALASHEAFESGALIEAPVCTACGGSGVKPMCSNEYLCESCHGTGYEPMVPRSQVDALVEAVQKSPKLQHSLDDSPMLRKAFDAALDALGGDEGE
jgi:hypothetical protein